MQVPKLPQGDDWLYEIKQDGYRAIGVVDDGMVLLYSMSGLDYTQQFPHIAFALNSLKRGNLVIDGEIVALDEPGRASLQELQNRKSTRRPIVYYIFDLLHLKGTDLFNLSLEKRQEMLNDLGSRFLDPLRLNPVFRTPLPRLIEQVRRLGLEGIVAKQANSLYMPGEGIQRLAETPIQSRRRVCHRWLRGCRKKFLVFDCRRVPRRRRLLHQTRRCRIHSTGARRGFRGARGVENACMPVHQSAGIEPIWSRPKRGENATMRLAEAGAPLRIGVCRAHSRR